MRLSSTVFAAAYCRKSPPSCTTSSGYVAVRRNRAGRYSVTRQSRRSARLGTDHLGQLAGTGVGVGLGPVRRDVAVREAHRRRADRAVGQLRVERVVPALDVLAAADLDLVVDPRPRGQLQHQVPQVGAPQPAQRHPVRAARRSAARGAPRRPRRARGRCTGRPRRSAPRAGPGTRSTAAASGRRSLSRLIASRRFTHRLRAAARRSGRPAAITRAPGGSAPVGVEVEPHAVVEHDAAGRRGPAGQLGHPRRVVGPQPPARVREQHAAGQPAQPGVEELRVRRAVRGPVVEQQHPLGQRHRPGRPGDHDAAAAVTANSRSTCSSTPTCPPATTSAAAASSDAGAPRRGAPRPPRPLPRPPGAPRTPRAPPAPGPGAARRRAGRAASASARAASRTGSRLPPYRATSRSAPSTPSSCTRYSSCSSSQRGPVLELGGRVLRVALQDVQPAGVQPQVDAAARRAARRARRRRARAPASRR